MPCQRQQAAAGRDLPDDDGVVVRGGGDPVLVDAHEDVHVVGVAEEEGEGRGAMREGGIDIGFLDRDGGVALTRAINGMKRKEKGKERGKREKRDKYSKNASLKATEKVIAHGLTMMMTERRYRNTEAQKADRIFKQVYSKNITQV